MKSLELLHLFGDLEGFSSTFKVFLLDGGETFWGRAVGMLWSCGCVAHLGGGKGRGQQGGNFCRFSIKRNNKETLKCLWSRNFVDLDIDVYHIKRTMRKIIIIFTVFATLLSTAFLWKEIDGFSLHKKINAEKIGNYFTSLGAIAAAISIYFLYKQLVEMKEARKATYQPDLYPSYSKFQVKDILNAAIFADGNKPSVKVFRLEDNQPQEQFRPYIELYNIGLGAAKNISIIWKYNVKDVENLITDIYQYYKTTEPESEHLDFLQANGKSIINIPFLYFICCGEQLNQTYLDIVEPVTEKPKPALQLQILYQDIQNNHFAKCFNVRVDAFTQFVDLKFTFTE